MGRFNYTKEQQRVIDYREGNLLVSAAAGSGKTAVLVERIIKLIENGEVDITELLVVTFTKASALEMRERIGEALYKKFLETKNPLYRNQILNLSIANISTFHSFCLKIIKNYFYKTGLDPNYYLGDDQLMNILREQAITEVMERAYENMDEDFSFLEMSLEGIGTYSTIKTLVLDIYFKAISRENPIEWLDNLSKVQKMNTTEDYFQSEVFNYIFQKYLAKLDEIKEKCEHVKKFIDDYHLDFKAINDIFLYDGMVDSLIELKDDKAGLISEISKFEKFPRATALRNKEEDPLIEHFKLLRSDIQGKLKGLITDFKESIFSEDAIEYQKNSECIVRALSTLTKDFIEEFARIKKRNTVIDYSDIEHLALKIVYDGDEISEEAREIRQGFKEILIDEYQDTNYVQESLINAISKESIGKPNVFMVGDLKQSIYKFRNSAPEIFAGKYREYTREKSQYTVINLNQNFRSRKNILHFINFVFESVMSEEIGDVSYDHEAMLYHGMKFVGDDKPVELLFAQSEKADIEAEAMMVARQIKDLVENEHYINDKKGGECRITYSDIVILVRAIKGRVDVFSDVFKKMGIPLVTPSKTGFFAALEIAILLNILQIIDNPLQDLALISVLKSPVFNFTDDELVEIKYFDKEVMGADFFYLLKNYNGKPRLKEKVKGFLDTLARWNRLKNDVFVYELLENIIRDTDYFTLVALGRSGKNAINNVKTLLSQCMQFESAGYKGLVAFNTYIAKLKTKDIDFGLSNDLEIDDFVSIMTIHNSKGLEFPVVFLSTLHKEFNKMDSRSKLLIHDKLGAGVDIYFPEEQSVMASPIKNIIKTAINTDNLSEELRLLYVAMTRARERLYLTASVKDGFEEKFAEKIGKFRIGDKPSPALVAESKNLLDFILLGLAKSSIFDEFVEGGFAKEAVKEPLMSLSVIQSADEEIEEKITERTEASLDKELREKIEKNLNFVYPFEEKTKIRLRTTVSALKNEGEDSKEENTLFNDLSEKEYKNALKSDKIVGTSLNNNDNNIKGARLGTLYHEMMRLIPFKDVESLEDIKAFLADLLEKDGISLEEFEAINPRKIFRFFETEIGKRAKQADVRGELFRERTFILGVDTGDDDMYMVQGMIDLYFIEDGKIVLLDYKTDWVEEAGEATLLDRYRGQMKYYKQALKGFSDLEVEEVYLYSFRLGKNIKM